MYKWKDINGFIGKLKQRDDFLLLDNRTIALNFINEVLNIDIDKNLDEIQKDFYELLGKDIDVEYINEQVEMPVKKTNGEYEKCLVWCTEEKIRKEFKLKSEDEFYNFVLENTLNIRGNIFKHFIRYFEQATKDLKRIDSVINSCKKDLEKKDIDQYLKNKLIHFIDLNTVAKEEIINFLCNDINDFIMQDMYKKQNKSIDLFCNKPYSCYKSGDRYSNKRNFSLEVKFFDLSAGDRQPYELYKNNIEEYYNYVTKYIDNNNVIEELISRIDNNYLLKNRKEFLSQIINTYRRNDYMAFIALSTIQIEGLFSDYLQVVDDNYKKGNITLVPKLQKIKDKTDFFYGYEYFIFEFPKLRNKMAHGEKLNSSNIKHIADEVLLDLRYVINLFNDEKLEPNKVFNILNNERNINELTFQCIILLYDNKYIEEYIFNNVRDNAIDEKYREKIETIRKNILNNEFWEFFREKIDKGELNLNYGIEIDLHKLLIKIRHIVNDYYGKEEYTTVNFHCTKINRYLAEIGKKEEEKNKKLKELLNSNAKNDI